MSTKNITETKADSKTKPDKAAETPWGRSTKFMAFTTLMGYAWLTIFGALSDFFAKLTGKTRFKAALTPQLVDANDKSKGYFPPLLYGSKAFYIRRLYPRFRSCFDLPICSPPGGRIDLLPREDSISADRYQYNVVEGLLERDAQVRAKKEGIIKNCVNLGSYNYLGFADEWKETCGDSVLKDLKKTGLVATSSYLEAGYTELHNELEQFVARFLHKEKAAVYGMGYGTNTTVLSALLGPGSVVLSDSLNHSSIINGCRGGNNTKIVPFKHNDMANLETCLQKLHLCGQLYPKLASEKEFTPWNKIIVVVEGIYSMEGETCELLEVIRLCKKYKAYLYVDEAHSIGALGKSGRGIVEHCGASYDDIDILMGTFSKSFGGMGGYVVGNEDVIQKLRASSDGQTTMSPMANVITSQVLTAFKIIDTPGGIGQQKIAALKENANYFRRKLIQLGCHVLGDEDSPVVPMMVFQPTKLMTLSHELRKRGIAIVTVAYPAVEMYEARIRFCISAAHTKEDLKHVIKEIHHVAKIAGVRYEKK